MHKTKKQEKNRYFFAISLASALMVLAMPILLTSAADLDNVSTNTPELSPADAALIQEFQTSLEAENPTHVDDGNEDLVADFMNALDQEQSDVDEDAEASDTANADLIEQMTEAVTEELEEENRAEVEPEVNPEEKTKRIDAIKDQQDSIIEDELTYGLESGAETYSVVPTTLTVGKTQLDDDKAFLTISEEIGTSTIMLTDNVQSDGVTHASEKTAPGIAKKLLTDNHASLNISLEDKSTIKFRAVKEFNDKFIVTFEQYYDDVPVVNGTLQVVLSNTGELISVHNNMVPDLEDLDKIVLTEKDAEKIVEEMFEWNDDTDTIQENILKISRIDGGSYFVYNILAQTSSPYGRWNILVDATSGEILDSYNELSFVGIQSDTYPRLSTDDMETKPMRYLKVESDGETKYTDNEGIIDWTTFTATLESPVAKIFNADQLLYNEPRQATMEYDSSDEQWYWGTENNDSITIDEANTFYQTGQMFAYYNEMSPITLSEPVSVYVRSVLADQAAGGCTAWHDPKLNTIELGRGGADCGFANTALSADIIRHEFSHAVLNTIHYYKPRGETGAIGEALSDYFSLASQSISPDQAVFGEGVLVGSRDLNNTLTLDDWVDGDYHYNSQILSSILWQLRTDSLDGSYMDSLILHALYLHPQTYEELMYAMIIIDDDDSDFTNATPHAEAILDTFFSRGVGPGFEAFDASLIPELEPGEQVVPEEDLQIQAAVSLTTWTPTSRAWASSDFSITFGWQTTAFDMTQISYCFNDGADCTPGSGDGWHYTYSCAGTSQSCSTSISGTSDGDYNVCGKAQDNTLAWSSTSCYSPYRKDSVVPNVSITGAPANWTASSQYANQSCTDPDATGRGVSGCSGTEYYRSYSSNPGSCPTSSTGYTSSAGEWIYGHYWVCGRQLDNASNIGVSSPTEFKIDVNDPTTYSPTITNYTPYCTNPHWTNDTSWTVSWSAASDAESGLYECKINVFHGVATPPYATLSTACASAGSSSYSPNGTPYSGQYWWAFTEFASDNVAHQIQSWSAYVSVDTTAPSTGSITYTDGYETTTTSYITTNRGSDVNWASSSLSCPSTAYKIEYNYATLSSNSCGTYSGWATATSDDDQISSYYQNLTSPRCYQFRYYVHDAAGNEALYTSANTVKYDSSIPSHSLTSISESSAYAYYNGSDAVYYNTASSGNFTVNVSASDSDSGVAYVNYGTTVSVGGYDYASPYTYTYSWDTYDTFNGMATYTACNLGSSCGAGIFYVYRDIAEPTTTPSDTSSTWRNTDVSTTLSCNDGSGSGCSATYYKVLDGDVACGAGGYSIYSGSVAVTCAAGSACQKSLCMYSVDNVSRTESYNKQLYQIDKLNPTCSISGISESSAYAHSSGTTVYYNTASTGSFTVNASASDANAGIYRVLFPTTVSAGASDYSAPYSLAYNWDTGDTYSASTSATCYDNAGNTATGAFTVNRDVTAPTGGSMDYTDGYSTTTTLNLTVGDGTDAASGINTASRGVIYYTCGMGSGSTGRCVPTTGPSAATLGGTYPNFTFSGTEALCYKFQYQVSDNVSNQATYLSVLKAGEKVICIDTWGTHRGHHFVAFDDMTNYGISIGSPVLNWVYSGDTRYTTTNLGTIGTITSGNVTNGKIFGGHQQQYMYAVSSSGGSIVEGTPETWFGTEFIFPVTRAGGSVFVYAPFENATVSFYDASISTSTPQSTVAVNAGAYTTFSTPNFTRYIVESTKPVILFEENGASDHNPVTPATLELFGIPSGSAHVSALLDNTVVWEQTDGGNWYVIGTINRGGMLTVSGTGTYFSGAARRVVANNPISVRSVADGNGSDSAVWIPYKYFGNTYVLPLSAAFASFAAVQSGTTIALKDTDGSTLNTYSMTSGSSSDDFDRGPAYYKIDNSVYTLSPGRYFVTSNPTWGVWDENTTGDETNFWNLPAERPFVEAGPFYKNIGNDKTPYIVGSGWDISSGIPTQAYRFGWRVNDGSWNYSSYISNRFYQPTLSADSTNYDFMFMVKDAAGNGDNVWNYFNDLTIENTVPTVTVNSPAAGSWQSANFTVDITNADTGGAGLFLCRYKVVDNSVTTVNWTHYTCGNDITVNVGTDCSDGIANACVVYFENVDKAGNESTEVTRSFSIDSTPADVNPVDAGPSSANRTAFTSGTWYNYLSVGSDDAVSFSWTDPSSPTDDTFYYELNTTATNTIAFTESNTTNPYIDSIALSEGSYYFHVASKEGNGSEGPERTFNIRYDKSVPQCYVDEIERFGAYVYAASVSQVYYNNAGTGSYNIIIDAYDSYSGIDYVEFPTITSIGGTDDTEPYSYTYTFDSGDTSNYASDFVCYDNLGHEGTDEVLVTRDITDPTGGWVTNASGYQTTLTDISVTANRGTDSQSGINTSYGLLMWRDCSMTGSGTCVPNSSYDSGDISGTYPNYTHTSLTNGNCYNYRFDANDNVSNTAEYVGTNTICIDTTAPAITSVTEDDANNIVRAAETVTITTNVTDGESGLISTCNAYWDDNTSYDGTEYSFGDQGSDCDGLVTIPDSTNGTWYLCTRPGNNAGLYSYGCTNALIYDESAPTTTISDTNSSWRNSDITGITLSCNDNGSAGCANSYYKTMTGDVACTAGSYTTYSSAFNVTCTAGTTCQYSVCYYSTDNAGNQESYNKQLYKIDHVNPSYVGYTINQCTYQNGSTCWVKDGDDFIVDIEHSDDIQILRPYFGLNKDDCTPNSCPVGDEIKSYWNPPSTTVVDTHTGDVYFDITSVSCADGDSNCADDDTVSRWTATASTGEDEFKLHTYIYDHVMNGFGYTDLNYWVNIDNTSTATDIADTDSNWRTTDVNTTLTCDDEGKSGCDTTYYKILTGDVSCTAGSYSTYSGSLAVTCSAGTSCIRSVCFYSVDNVGNEENFNKQLYRIDKGSPDVNPVDAGPSSGDRTSWTSGTWYNYANSGSDDQISFSWTDPNSGSDDTFYYELNTTSTNTIDGTESSITTPYIDAITISEGTSYMHVRAQSGVGTWGTERTFTVLYDKSEPNCSLTALDSTYSTAPASISGTASDTYSGVQNVEIKYHNTTNSLYWNGTGWTGTETWISTTGTTTWSISSGLPVTNNLTNDHTYDVSCRATDNVGYVESTPDIDTFKFVPSISITGDSTVAFSTNLTGGGSAVSEDGALQVQTTSSGGFQITINRSSSRTATMQNGTIDFPDKTVWSSSSNNAVPWSGDGFGFRVKETGTYACAFSSTWWGTDISAEYAGVPNYRATRNTIASCTDPQNNEARDIIIEYRAEAPATQASGTYQGIITYTATTTP